MTFEHFIAFLKLQLWWEEQYIILSGKTYNINFDLQLIQVKNMNGN